MNDNDHPTLGTCCVCGTDQGVVNVMMLNQRGPMPGYGWGCVVCGLPSDGAIAVVCDQCVGQPIKFVCRGYPGENDRVPVHQLPVEAFDHDEAKHRADEAHNA